jgi:uncharacterized protein (DUF697 family)
VELKRRHPSKTAWRIRFASVVGAVLGAVPAPTSALLTALQVGLVRSIAAAHGRRPSREDVLAMMLPITARAVGITAWNELGKMCGPSMPFGMITGAALGGGLTYAVGRASEAYWAATDPSTTASENGESAGDDRAT